MTDPELVKRAISAYGGSARGFATYIMGRDERTIRYWLAGRPIPEGARAFMERFTKNTQTEHQSQ